MDCAGLLTLSFGRRS